MEAAAAMSLRCSQNPVRNMVAAAAASRRESIFSRRALSMLDCRVSIIGLSRCRRNTQVKRWRIRSAVACTSVMEKSTFDVVVVGAGIIGLTIARQILLKSDLSVAVVDAEVPCSGATGAGQGYLWMIHKTPGSPMWEFFTRSKQLWDLMVESIKEQGMDPLKVLGLKRTGSLLIGRNQDEIAMLEKRVRLLTEGGLRAQCFTASDLLSIEPALEGGDACGAAFLPDDCQLDAQLTVSYIEQVNNNFAASGRYAAYYFDPVTSLLRSGENGEVEGVKTSKRILYSRTAVVIAAGAWSGSLMQSLVKESDMLLDIPVKPRKGHLIVLENNQVQLKHGLMEVGYIDHKLVKPLSSSASGEAEDQTMTSISMAVTIDMNGNLVVGSSRQFTGFNTEVEESIIKSIWERAGLFIPALRELPLMDFVRRRKIRTGLRPYMTDGKPLIGHVPGIRKVLLATGHEGEGILTALGTAEIITDMILGNTGKVDWTPFSFQGRCCR